MSNNSTALEPRKRPKQARSTATMEAVIEAATHILQRDGLPAFNTNDVASRAGVSIGSLYQYFPSKEAILTEIVRRKRSDLYHGLMEAVARYRDGSFEEMVRHLVDVKVQLQLRGHNMSRAVDYANSFLPLNAETEELSAKIIDLVAGLLATRNIKHPHEAARDVVGIARGLIEAAALAGETESDALVERACRAVHGYLSQCEICES